MSVAIQVFLVPACKFHHVGVTKCSNSVAAIYKIIIIIQCVALLLYLCSSNLWLLHTLTLIIPNHITIILYIKIYTLQARGVIEFLFGKKLTETFSKTQEVYHGKVLKW